MERYIVHFTYRGGRFEGRKGKRTVQANNNREAGHRVSYMLNHTTGRFITVDRIESLPQEDK